MFTSQQKQMRYAAGALALLIAAGLYLLTLDNGLRPEELTGGDLITHQYAQVQGRLSNAPGYPLYTIGGWLWFRLGRAILGQIFNPIEVLSLYSTLWGLASLLVLYLILVKVTGRRWSITFWLTLFYASTFFFWYYSVTTEQYTSAVFQTLLAIWLAFKWDGQPRHSTLLGLALLCGTMLANMVTTLFILPPLLWFILFRPVPSGDRRFYAFYLRRPGLVLQAVGLALLPLLSYGYIYLRGAQHPEWRGQGNWTATGEWFVQFLTIQQGRNELSPGLTLENFFTAEFPALMGQELTWPLFLGGLLGLACLGRRRAIWLYTTLLIYVVFCWGYRFGNWFQVIIPAYPIFIIGVAAGLAKILDTLEKNRSQFASGLALYAANFILAGLLLYRFLLSLPDANQRNQPDDTGLDPGWAILADQPSRPAVISSLFEERVALDYLRIVWQAALEIYPTTPGEFRPVGESPAGELARYITRGAAAAAPEAIGPAGGFLQAAGEQLIALRSTPRTELPPAATTANLNFGDTLELVGWERIEAGVVAPIQTANWQIALYWRAPARLKHNYTISVRPLVDGQLIEVGGQPLIQDHQPVWGLYPTGRWQPGEIVRDVYALSLPPGVGPDEVQIVIYRATETGFENLAMETIWMGAEK